jgi:biopolymer transport protein ExbD
MRFGTVRGSRGRPAINLVSMIDATFLLLSFFLVTAASSRVEGRLTGALGTTGGAAGDLQAVVVEVHGSPGAAWYRVAGRRIDGDPALRAALEGLPKPPGVALRVHSGPSAGDAAAALQAVRDAGFERVSYAPAP